MLYLIKHLLARLNCGREMKLVNNFLANRLYEVNATNE